MHVYMYVHMHLVALTVLSHLMQCINIDECAATAIGESAAQSIMIVPKDEDHVTHRLLVRLCIQQL